MYQAHVDAKNHRFTIEDRDGNVIAERHMPSWRVHAGREELMGIPENQKAWVEVYNLAKHASDGAYASA